MSQSRFVSIHSGGEHCFREDHCIARQFIIERKRAHDKHDPNGFSMEREEWDSDRWLPVLMEELGEVARAICDSEPKTHLRAELIQVGAMVNAWIVAIDGGTHWLGWGYDPEKNYDLR